VTKEDAISVVRDHIFISTSSMAANQQSLEEHAIRRAVMVLGPDKEDRIIEHLINCYVKRGMTYMLFPIRDESFTDKMYPLLRFILSWIEKAEESRIPTLIHCRYGISRSPALVTTYLVQQGMTFEDALRLVRQARPIANPLPDVMESFLRCIGHGLPKDYTRIWTEVDLSLRQS